MTYLNRVCISCARSYGQPDSTTDPPWVLVSYLPKLTTYEEAPVSVMESMCDDMPALSIVIKLEFAYH